MENNNTTEVPVLPVGNQTLLGDAKPKEQSTDKSVKGV
jgi:hypothetical protein